MPSCRANKAKAIVTEHSVYHAPLARPSAVGRIYITIASVCLLLLLAWHYAIQETAHRQADSQIRAWLKQMHARAGQIGFRMLRGTLVVHDIQATLAGGELRIAQILLKGNPASVGNAQPVLQQVIVQHADWDAATLPQHWQTLPSQLPNTLQGVFRHARRIQVQGRIRNAWGLPDIHIDTLRIDGAPGKRHVTGGGYIGNAKHPWRLEAHAPNQGAARGEMSAIYQGITSQAQWQGAWQSQEFEAHITQQHRNSSLKIDARHADSRWRLDIDAKDWYIASDMGQARITGKGQLDLAQRGWIFASEKLQLAEAHAPMLNLNIAQAEVRKLRIDSQEHTLSAQDSSVQNVKLTWQAAQSPSIPEPWRVYMGSISIRELHPVLQLKQSSSITLPALNGHASLQGKQLAFDISFQEKPSFIHITYQQDQARISAKGVPLHKLRNLLPQPVQTQATDLHGDVTLELGVSPFDQWATQGSVHVDNLHIASQNQAFTAKTWDMLIQHADLSGVRRSTIQASQWSLQLPLIPRQAWHTPSHWRDWANLPWQAQSVAFDDGRIYIGDARQEWLSGLDVRIVNWQSDTEASLQASGLFGLSPWQLTLGMQQQGSRMQWRTLRMKTAYANMFTLSPWLQLSGLPPVLRGKLSADIRAKRGEQGVQGQAKLVLHRLQCDAIAPEDDYLMQAIGQSGQSIVQRLGSQEPHITYQVDLAGGAESDVSEILGQALLSQTQLKLQQAGRDSKSATRTQYHEHLGSIRIHQDRGFSHNERTRLRQMIRKAKRHGGYIDLTPDLGTTTLTPELKKHIYHTQTMIRDFMHPRGIPARKVYLIAVNDKQHGTNSTAAVHVNLVKP